MRQWIVLTIFAGLVIIPMVAVSAAPPQKITIIMREYSYTPDRVTVTAGSPVEISITNRGKRAHEFMLYDMPRQTGMMMGHEWVEQTNYFRGLTVTVNGGKVTRKAGSIFEVFLKPGQSATIVFTPVKKGTFEFSCMITGHYEKGQRGEIVVR